MASRGAGARMKGIVFERHLVNVFKKVMPWADIHRGIQTRGPEAADVVMPHLHIEAKCYSKTYSPRAALMQAIKDAPKDKWPVAIVKDNHKTPIVAMTLDDFVELFGLYSKEVDWPKGVKLEETPDE